MFEQSAHICLLGVRHQRTLLRVWCTTTFDEWRVRVPSNNAQSFADGLTHA
jgi:hypothetical protein